MRSGGPLQDLEGLTDRVMIEVYKKRIREERLDPGRLKGTWAEASRILEEHFGRLSRVMDRNASKLLKLYRLALKEVRGECVPSGQPLETR